MMIRFDPRELDDELSGAVEQLILEVANELVNQLQIESPTGATGRLSESWQIFRTGDGVVWLGSRVDYARYVLEGTEPHTPPFEPIEVYARRVIGDESAAGPLWQSIRQDGTEPNDYLGRAIENTADRAGRLQVSGL